MTDIETALAEALEACGYWRQDYQNRDHAQRILAAPQMQALARQAAIGAAVERLDADNWGIVYENGRYYVSNGPGEYSAGLPTLPKAIAAALGEDDE